MEEDHLSDFTIKTEEIITQVREETKMSKKLKISEEEIKEITPNFNYVGEKAGMGSIDKSKF